ETYPDVFAAVGVHSGLAAGAATDMPSAFGAMHNGGSAPTNSASRMPTIVFHGDADHTVSIKNAEQVLAASVGENAALQAEARADASGSRKITRTVSRDDTNGKTTAESWTIHGAPHAWSGGRAVGSFTDQSGPDATMQMLRFFKQHKLAAAR
ncbi:MAG: PHB depolymerase family esterase, partial [Burkholderiales bacterium]